jgi:hypothetical protein
VEKTILPAVPRAGFAGGRKTAMALRVVSWIEIFSCNNNSASRVDICRYTSLLQAKSGDAIIMPASITPGSAVTTHDDLVFLDEAPARPSMAPPPASRRVARDDRRRRRRRPLDHHLRARQPGSAGPSARIPARLFGRPRRANCSTRTDIAVILLDVVMEQDDAGLHLVRHIRETLGMATCASSCAPASRATRPRWTRSATSTSTITAPSPNSPAPSCTPRWPRRSAPTSRSARSEASRRGLERRSSTPAPS